MCVVCERACFAVCSVYRKVQKVIISNFFFEKERRRERERDMMRMCICIEREKRGLIRFLAQFFFFLIFPKKYFFLIIWQLNKLARIFFLILKIFKIHFFDHSPLPLPLPPPPPPPLGPLIDG